MISGWWLVLVFAVGAYAGIALFAALVVSSREPEPTDAWRLGDDPRMALIAAEWMTDGPAARPGRERSGGKRGTTSRRSADPVESQATLPL
jgi:hypothetical protein